MPVHLERFSPTARDTIHSLEERVEAVVADVTASEFFTEALAPQTSADLTRSFLREVFLRVYWYQQHTTEAGFHMLGRLPKSENKLLRTLVKHKAEEAEHGEWALRDYLALGGDQRRALEPPSPPTFAVIGVWWRMAIAEDPFGYLGAEYLFEYLTVRITALTLPIMKAKEIDQHSIGFMVEHATEDVKHTNLLRHCIGEVVTRRPETSASMFRCFEYFHQVYPIAVWADAYQAIRTVRSAE